MGEGAQILLVQDPGNKGSRAVKVWGAWAAILKEKRWRFQWKSPLASALPVSREKPHDFAELLLLGAPGCLRVLARVRGMGNMLHFLTSLISQ